MRVDLFTGGRRPLYMRLGLKLIKWRTGVYPDNLINRVADAFDYPVPTGKQKARLAAILNLSGKLLKGSQADTVWTQAADGRIRPPEVERGRTRMLSASGKTDTMLRQSVEAFVTAQWEHPRSNTSSTPPELQPYLKKLALHADFPNLDLTGRHGDEPGLADTFSFSLLLTGQQDGQPVYQATTLTIQGDQVYVESAEDVVVISDIFLPVMLTED